MRENALKAVADPTRRRILQLVQQEPSSVGDIARHFDTTQQAISQHLTLLRNAGCWSSGRSERATSMPCAPTALSRSPHFWKSSGRNACSSSKAAAEAGKKGR